MKIANNNDVQLRIATNSTRRVRWYTKLGFHKVSSIPINRIRTILPYGGSISKLSAHVVKVYPIMFLEKNENNTSVICNEKAELKKSANFEKERQTCIETILSQVTREVLKENAPSEDISRLESDYDSQNYRYEDGEKLRTLIRERMEKRLPPKFSKNRRVSSILKLRITDSEGMENEEDVRDSAILTLWNPSEEILAFFKEGNCYAFYTIMANGLRNNELQLSTTRSSKYDTSPSPINCSISYRNNTTVNQLIENKDSAKFGEVDMVGIVIKIERAAHQTVYLADLLKNIFAISFRLDSKNFDHGDTLHEENIVACVNLQWKKGYLFWKIPVLYASEYTSFLSNVSRYSLLQECVDEFKTYFKNEEMKTFVKECEISLQELMSSRETSTVVEASIEPSVSNIDKAPEKPADIINPCNKTKVQRKIEKLRIYGEPPPLSPLILTAQPKIRNKLSVRRRSMRNVP